MKIALVEDDEVSQKYVTDILQNYGYKVSAFSDGETFLKSLREEQFVLVILDINLPKMNGYDICYFIKKFPENYGDPKLLMLSERVVQEDINKGLLAGADEYIKKPFDETEFILRVNSLLRRGINVKIDKTKYKDLNIDFEQSVVVENGKEIELSQKEKELLQFLIKNKGLIVSKEKIYSEVWEDKYDAGNKTVEVYILKLKKKINLLKDNIQNYRNMGYKLVV